jgi:addiction module RelE/StbE family toxin
MKIDYHKKFIKDFNKLSPKLKQKFYDRLRIFSREQFYPLLNNHPVDVVYPGWRSINVTGDYRALYETQGEDLVKFMRIGTHSELYR